MENENYHRYSVENTLRSYSAYKDLGIQEDLGHDAEEAFFNMSVEDKLNTIKVLHGKYLGKYKYMYFLPTSNNWKLKFKQKETHQYWYEGWNTNYEYEFGDELEKSTPYYITKYRKSLEKDNDALIYRYNRMVGAIKRRQRSFLRRW